ncbi:MAG: 1-acyl-sn-glycerol-3-phosphate acyltransferase [Gemmatimonadaceae bacterium]|nr:1-acyl-sn-glycerol-3-phosphate acyltransferase [Gemmatimonadaceae bacterium]
MRDHPLPAPLRRRPWALGGVRLLCRFVLRMLNIRVVWQGPAVETRGALLVANHFSWIDIVAVLARTDCTFVAKREVRSWPIVGWCADAIGVVWIDRTRKRDLLRSIPALEARLKAGLNVLVFPEGTTTDGRTLLPFKSSLLDAAVRAGAPVQPLALTATAVGDARALSWTGRDTLADSLPRVLRLREACVTITALPPVSSHSAWHWPSMDMAARVRRLVRQRLARVSRAAIAHAVGTDAIREQPLRTAMSGSLTRAAAS